MISHKSVPPNWELKSIPEVVFFQEGPGVRKHQYTETGVKLLNVGNLNGGKVDLSTTTRFVSEDEAYGRYKHFLVDEGDLLIGSSGITVDTFDQKIAIVESEHLPLCMNTSTIRFKTLDPNLLDINYFRHFLSTRQFKGQLRKLITGTAQLNFGPSHLKQMKIPLPPLSEQKRIADILDKADAIRRKRQEVMSSLGELRRSQFNAWFEPWFSSQPEGDFVPVSHFVERFEGGLNVATPDSASESTRHFVLKVSAVTWGDYRHDECKPLHPEYDPPPGHFVRKDDLLFSRANTTELVGATAYVYETPDNRVLPDKLWRFVWKEGISLEPLFVWALFNHPQVRYEIGKRATGTSGSMKNISMQKVLDITVPWPDIEVQHRFALFLKHERELCQKMEDSLKTAHCIFNSLVQRAFKGEL